MLAAAAVLPQSTEAMALVVLEAVVVEMYRALTSLAVVVVGGVQAQCLRRGGWG
jgi:hypothetical protein